jgi:subtilisin family serine protease
MGIAYGATIAAFRADSAGSCASSGGCTFNDTDIAAGINAAINAGAKVVNISLGGGAQQRGDHRHQPRRQRGRRRGGRRGQ